MIGWQRFLGSGICALGLLGLSTASVGADEGNNLIEFQSMTGVPVGHPTVRTIPGGGLPWVITEGEGQVDGQGNVEVEVQGLIIPLPLPQLGNQPGNPIKFFSATVSCLDANGVAHNVTTGLFPATVPGGNSEIEAHVNLPHPCNSPEVFVGTTNAAGTFVWFAHSNPGQDN